jgi:type I restriction enzyme S subunit
MNKTVTLKKVAKYSEDRININSVNIDNYITTDNMLQNKLGVEKVISMPPQDGNVTAYYKSNILIGNIRPYLKKIWFATKDGGNSADVLTLQVKQGYDPKFVYYSLYRDDFFIHMMKGSKGTKMPRGDKNQIMYFLIPDFNLSTQQKIASVLSTLDKKIELNNKINKELESMAKTLYDYWFVQFDFPNENGKPYKSLGGKMVYNEALKREIPERWETDSLWNIARYFNGLAMQKHRPISEHKLRVIKIKEMNEGFGNHTEYAKSDIAKEAIIQNGDVLFSWSASLDVMIWSRGKGALNQHIFKVTSDKYPKSFYYFELINYLKHFKMMADLRKTTMGHITQEHLKQSKIVIPPLSLIKRLDEKIKVLLNKKVLMEQENQELSNLRDWLLPMLMNGQVKVK